MNKDDLVEALREGYMATTTFRRDFLRRILNPGTTATDYLGRLTTHPGLRRPCARRQGLPASGAVTLNEYIDIPASRIVYQVTVAGTTAAAAPTPPGVGNTVRSTATFRQMTNG